MSEVMIQVRGGGTSSDDVTASRSNILQGKTTVTSDSDDEIVEGTMPNCGAKTAELACGESYPIPEGYHDGKGKVTAKSLDLQTQASAAAGDILKDKTAYVNGSKVTGTMANQGAKTASLNCGGSYTIPAGYHNGSGKVTANSLASQTSGTAAVGNILKDKTAWVNGNKITGTIASRGAATITPGTANQTIAAGQYLSGAQTIKGDANLKAANIALGTSIFNISGSAKLIKSQYVSTPIKTTTSTSFKYTGGNYKNNYYIEYKSATITPMFVFANSLVCGAMMKPGYIDVIDSSSGGCIAMSDNTTKTSMTKALIKMPVGYNSGSYGPTSYGVYLLIIGY